MFCLSFSSFVSSSLSFLGSLPLLRPKVTPIPIPANTENAIIATMRLLISILAIFFRDRENNFHISDYSLSFLLTVDKFTNKDFQKTLKILTEKKLGDLGWIEYRDLKKGSEAFDEIHNGTCVAPKIILIP